MAMNVGGGEEGGLSSQIDMTPMISVLLVLIIFFIIAQQGLQKGVDAQVPPVQKEKATQQTQQTNQIVLQVQPGPQYLLNKQPVPTGQLQEQLHKVFAPRIRKVLFIKGSGQVAYGQVVYAVDAARAAGIEVVGLVPRSNSE